MKFYFQRKTRKWIYFFPSDSLSKFLFLRKAFLMFFFLREAFPIFPGEGLSNFYRMRSRGDNMFGSVHVFVCLFVCGCVCHISSVWTIWPTTSIFGMDWFINVSSAPIPKIKVKGQTVWPWECSQTDRQTERRQAPILWPRTLTREVKTAESFCPSHLHQVHIILRKANNDSTLSLENHQDGV